MFNKTIIINVYTFTVPYMPTLERLKAVRMGGGGGGPEFFFRRTQNGTFFCIFDIQSV